MMRPEHNRRSIRLKDYDYSLPAAYFVTICAQERMKIFGEIVDEEMRLNQFGQIIEQRWKEIPDHFPTVRLDEYVIMPNHVHGIIVILDDDSSVGARSPRPYRQKPTLGKIVAYFKYQSTKQINLIPVRLAQGFGSEVILTILFGTQSP